jgi:hypothetical protein
MAWVLRVDDESSVIVCGRLTGGWGLICLSCMVSLRWVLDKNIELKEPFSKREKAFE